MNPLYRLLAAAVVLAAAPGLARAEFIYGLTARNSLVLFDSATPGTVSGPIAVTGLAAGDTLVGIDFRPATQQLYALSRFATGAGNRLYVINPSNGAVAQTLNLTLNGAAFALGGSFYGVDFNPMADRLRVVTDAGANYNINPATGEVLVQGSLAYVASGDINSGAVPFVVASAYSNNVAGATSTTLYGIEANGGYLVTQVPATGVLDTVGTPGAELPLGPPTSADASFDISGRTGVAYAVLNGSTLSTINLGTGQGTVVGDLGGPGFIVGIAVAPVPAPPAAVLLGVGAVAGLAGRRIRRRA